MTTMLYIKLHYYLCHTYGYVAMFTNMYDYMTTASALRQQCILSKPSNATSYRSLTLDIGPLPERGVALEVWLSIHNIYVSIVLTCHTLSGDVRNGTQSDSECHKLVFYNALYVSCHQSYQPFALVCLASGR